MTVKKILLSIVIVTIVALAAISCGGTKNICPAYSDVQTSAPAQPNS